MGFPAYWGARRLGPHLCHVCTVTHGTDARCAPDKVMSANKELARENAGELPHKGVPPMTELSVRHLQPFANTAMPSHSRKMDRALNRLGAAFGPRDLMLVAAFCAIGIALTFAVLARVPELSDAIGQIALVP